MAKALRLARRGICTTDPNPRVGCVLVKDGTILSVGWHQRMGEDHAEIRALNMAGAAARDSILYTTLEPCCFHGNTPPCVEALMAAGVKEVHIAMLDPHPQVAGKGLAFLRTKGMKVSIGLLADQAQELNKGFVKRWTTGMPWVRCKLALSMNGVAGIKRGYKTVITGTAARMDVHKWRARSSAIITSAATIHSDDALLNARLVNEEVKQPLRVVLDTNFNLSPLCRFFTQGKERLWVGAKGVPFPTQLPAHTHAYQLPRNRIGLCLRSLLEHLGTLEMNEVMVEAGPRLTASFIKEGLLDELILYLSPRLLEADPLMSIQLDYSSRFEWKDVRFLGQDIRLVLHPNQRN